MLLVALENRLILCANNWKASAWLQWKVVWALKQHVNFDIFLLNFTVENIFSSFNLIKFWALTSHDAL